MSDLSGRARAFPISWLTEAGVLTFFVVTAFLLIARTDYDPVTRYISEYAVGPGGWAVRAAFVLLGLASLNLLPGFVGRGAVVRSGRVAASLGLWGLAVLVAAAFPVDLQGRPVTPTGAIHLAASVTGFVALVAAMGFASRSFRRAEGRRGLARLSRWAAILTAASFVLEASVFASLGWVGVGQWLLFGIAGAWLAVLGRRLATRRQPTIDADRSEGYEVV